MLRRLFALTSIVFFAFGTTAAGQVASRGREALEDFDERPLPASGSAPASISRAVADPLAGLRRRLPDIRVDQDLLHGAPAYLRSTRGFLTAPQGAERPAATSGSQRFSAQAQASMQASGDPHAIIKTFVDQNQELFGHGSAALTNARVRRDYIARHNNARTVVWEQQVNGIGVFGALFQAHLTSRGELVNVASRFITEPEQAVERGTPDRATRLVAPPISGRDAVAIAARNVGEQLAAVDVTPIDIPLGAEARQRFQATPLHDATARFVWLPMDGATLRLAWEVVLTSKTRGGEMFRVIVDAETGRPQLRQGLTNDISNASYRVFTSDSPSPFSPGHATPLSTQPSTVARTLVTTPALNTTASPDGWIDDGVTETRGNNVDAHTDVNADNQPDLPRPQATGAGRVFDPGLALTRSPSNSREAAVVNLFYWCNWMHDRLYELGFTEAAGNFQNNNFGRGGLGSDAIQADAQDGSGYDNANFSTPPDGSPGRMQMYLFTGTTPYRDASFDADIILHEYAHGLSNRLVGGGVGISALQSRGMGEGWSDFYALALLSESTDDLGGNYAAGAYSTYQWAGMTTNYYYGIRRYPYSTNLTKNPLTFKDIDPSQASAHTGIPLSPIGGGSADEVHNMGEVWCVTLWDARANLINKHGYTIGNELILQLVTDGMKLSPANPNFIQARDAILQADLVHTGGANHNELWAAFAKRGMGAQATSPGSYTSFGVVESFDVPDDLGISPKAAPVFSGTVGGPFKPDNATYTLLNSGSASLTWTATKTGAWFDLSAAAGALTPGTTATITVTPNLAANSLVAGRYSETITFTNTTSGVVQSYAVVLEVEPFTVPIFSETFESGTLDSARWALSGTNQWRTLVTTSNAPHGGTRHLTMDSSSDGYYSRNEATLTLNLAGESGLALRFWAKHFSDEPHGPPPAPFTNGADFDGVAISADGTNWYEVQPLRGSAISRNWMMFNVDLDAAIAARGLSYTSVFKIRFNQYDNYRIATDGIAIDDVQVMRVVHNRLAFTLPAGLNENASSADVTLVATPPPTSPLVVALSSSSAILSAPASLTVPAGQGSLTFAVTPVDDVVLNGSRPVALSGTASGWVAASGTIAVHDNETATLALTVPATVTEGSTDVRGTLTLSAAPAADVVVQLSSDDAKVQPPATVTVLAGRTRSTNRWHARFNVNGVSHELDRRHGQHDGARQRID
jgi:hypothetical protein